jgi:tungstate transport system substrate-binding protein
MHIKSRKIYCLLPIALFFFSILPNISLGALQEKKLKVASACEPVDTGLIYTLNEPFEFKFQAFADITKMGVDETYKAIKNGEVDLVIVNYKDFVDKLSKEKLTKCNEVIFSNNLSIYGPVSDPCKLNESATILGALKILKDCNFLYYYTDKDFGIDRVEKKIWSTIGGMSVDAKFMKTSFETKEKLLQADKDRTYCLVDSGTYNENKGTLSGKLFCSNDKTQKNEYYACVVSEKPGKSKNYVLAMAYFGWLTSKDGQKIIRDFKKNDEIIFTPVMTNDDDTDKKNKEDLQNNLNPWETQ